MTENASFFLLDALSERVGDRFVVKLRCYDDVSGRVEELQVANYSPYFLLRHPLSDTEKNLVDSLHGAVETVWKHNLFVNELQEFSKVRVREPQTPSRFEKKLDNVWETEIEFARSYIYDEGLVFGAPYKLENNRLLPVWHVSKELKTRFEAKFAQIKASDPLKYAQLEHWFSLFHQPIPQIEPEKLRIKNTDRFNPDDYTIRFMLARIANIPVSEAMESRSVSDWLKSMIYTYLRKHGVLVPNSKELRRGQETHCVPGALTITPKSGVYFNTVVCDFESLYPSCIDSYNLSYETVDCGHEECRLNTISNLNHYVCTRRRGFYSVLVGALKDLRIHWLKPLAKDHSLTEKEKNFAEAATRMLKLIAVSSYGVTVRIHGLACPPLAECITGYGRYALQSTWKIAEDEGMQPTYGDTDSIFLDSPKPDQVVWLIKTIKDRLRLDLAMDKTYTVCVLSKAKKAYFGVFPDGSPDLKGLTAVKSNAPAFIQNVFRNCVRELAGVKGLDEYELAKKRMIGVVQDAIDELRQHKVPFEDLVYSVRLYFDPKERMRESHVFPQPYQCALQLINSGKKLGRRDTVRFVKVKPFEYKGRRFTVKPAEKVQNVREINVEDYVRNLLTALNQTFEPMGVRLMEGGEAKITRWLGSNS